MLPSESRGTTFGHARGQWLTTPHKSSLKRIHLCLNMHVFKKFFEILKDTSFDLTTWKKHLLRKIWYGANVRRSYLVCLASHRHYNALIYLWNLGRYKFQKANLDLEKFSLDNGLESWHHQNLSNQMLPRN